MNSQNGSQVAVRPDSRTRNRTAAVIAVVLLALATFFGTAASAEARGSFSQKVTPWGCSETDFAGNSYSSGGTVAANTYHNNVVCTTNLQVGARVTAGGSSSALSTSVWGNVTASMNSSSTPYGYHRLCVRNFAQTTYQCNWSRNT